MILVAYQHGLRAAELCALRWDELDLSQGVLHVRRGKSGVPSVHPMGGGEIRDLRRLNREQIETRHVFLTERRAPISPAGFRKMLARVGEGCQRRREYASAGRSKNASRRGEGVSLSAAAKSA